MDEKIDKKPKTGGRTKGTPNKRTLKFSESLEETGFNIAAEAVKLYQSTEDVHIKHKLLLFMANFTVPVPKATEVNPDESNEDQNPEVKTKSSEDLLKLIAK